MKAVYELQFLQALALTIFTETAVLFLLLRYVYKIGKTSINTPLIVFGGILSSSATLPYVWFILPAFITNFFVYTVAAESFAVFAEACIVLFLFRLSLSKSFLFSLICNMSSFVTGKMIQSLIKWSTHHAHSPSCIPSHINNFSKFLFFSWQETSVT